MRVKYLYIMITMLLILVLSGCSNQEEQLTYLKQEQSFEYTTNQLMRKSTDLEFYSTNVYDVKTIFIEKQRHTIMFNDDAIYSINREGIIKNKVLHSLPELKETREKEPLISMHIEVINDIDGRGFDDLLVVVKEGIAKDTESIMAISYEDGRVLWEYTPSINLNDCDQREESCEKPQAITHYEVDDYLYLSAGYTFYVIDLETGAPVNNYKSHNNIWDFEFVSDLTSDDLSDLVLVTQPNVLTVLDGKSLSKVKDFKIKSDIMLNSYIRLERNVWDIEYMETRDLLIAASENGIVYEISLNEEEVKWYEVIYNSTTEKYKNSYITMIEKNSDFYEQKVKDNQLRIYFGRGSNVYKNMLIHPVKSIDEDLKNDYIVSYESAINESEKQQKSYAIISSEQGKVESNLGNQFYSASSNYYFVLDDPAKNDVLLKDIEENENIVNQLLEQTSQIEHNMISKVFYLEDQLVVLTKDLDILSFNVQSEVVNGINLQYRLYSQRIRQEHEVIDQYLIIKDYDLKLELSQLTLYDDAFNQVYQYQLQLGNKLVDYAIDKNLLYLIEKNNEGSNYQLQVINLKDQSTVKDVTLFRDEVYLTPYLYDDISGDGYLEVVTSNFRRTSTALKHSFGLFDFINNEQLYHFERSFSLQGDNSYSQSTIKVLDDLNGDGFKDIFYNYIAATDGKSIPYLFLSDKETQFKEPLPLPNNRLYSSCGQDYNANGNKELIDTSLNHDPSIYDYTLSEFIPIQLHDDVTYKHSFVQRCNIDINQDGINEFVTLEMSDINPFTDGASSDEYQIELNLKVNEFSNNELIPLFNYEFTYVSDYVSLSTLDNQSLNSKFATYAYDEQEQVYKIVLFKYDDYHNIILEEINVAGTLSISETYVSNPHSQVENDGEYRYGEDLSTVTFNNQLYYLATINDKDFSKHYLINANSNEIELITYGENIRVYSDQMVVNKTIKHLDNKLLLNDELNKVLITVPFNAADIEVKKSGLLGNYYDILINREDVKRIRHYYSENEYMDYYDNQVRLVLPPGNHILKLEVETTNGELFYFSNVLTVDKNDHYLFSSIGILITTVILTYVLTLFVIKKFYYKK